MVGPNAVKVHSFVQSFFNVAASSLVTTLTISLRSEAVRFKVRMESSNTDVLRVCLNPSRRMFKSSLIISHICYLPCSRLLCCYLYCPLIRLRYPLISLLRGVSFACTQACSKTIFVTSQAVKKSSYARVRKFRTLSYMLFVTTGSCLSVCDSGYICNNLIIS
jgi:hypothetical protein